MRPLKKSAEVTSVVCDEVMDKMEKWLNQQVNEMKTDIYKYINIYIYI